jgi:hypothetical protein
MPPYTGPSTTCIPWESNQHISLIYTFISISTYYTFGLQKRHGLPSVGVSRDWTSCPRCDHPAGYDITACTHLALAILLGDLEWRRQWMGYPC